MIAQNKNHLSNSNSKKSTKQMKTKNNAQGKKRTGGKLIACSQILILLIASFAFSYLIYQSSAPFEMNTGNTQSDSSWGKITETLLKFIIQKIRQPILPMISAQGSFAGWACCEKNNNGAFCTYRPKSECNSAFSISPNECEETNFCKPGCCIGNSRICNVNTAKTNCNGIWFEQASCNIQECKKGCCVLGDESKFITEKECQIKAGDLGISIDFRNEVNSEISCLYLTEKQVQGACVLETEQDFETTRNCIFTTLSNCDTKKGNFYADIFCSNSELNTACTTHDHTGCLEGKDEVYWYDSCGNREEVKESCSIFTGTRCGQYRLNIDTNPAEGDYVCRDLRCNVEIDGKVVNKKNGESWCEYEGCIGNGKDPVGSKHIRHICYMGEEKTEACDDFRNQICAQSDTKLADNSIFSEAFCRVNRWRDCYKYNNERNDMAEKCKQNPDCTIKGVHIDKFNFDVCVPNYPPGFQFWNTEETARSGELECSFATQTCPVVYVKRITGWECEVNCDCEKSGFTQQMNDLCISLGDCGGYINFNGDYTDDGYSVGRAGRIDGNQYKTCAENQPNQKPAEPGNFGFSQILGIPGGLGEGDVPETDSTLGLLGVAGILGPGLLKNIAVVGATASATGTWTSLYGAGPNQISSEAFRMVTSEYAGNFGPEAFQQSTTTGKGLPVGRILGAAGTGLSFANFMQAGFGADKEISYGVGGVVALITFLGWCPPCMIIGLILSVISMIAGLGKTKTKYVTFTCMPWQPETGGLNCDLCNTNDPLGVPCSEYRCKSLGQTCEFINPRTEDEKCIANNPNDVSSPRIKPLYNNITQGYEYKSVSDSGFEIKTNNGECVPEYTVLSFGIETNKPARCRIGTDVLETYDEMGEFFGGKNSFIIDHIMQLAVPSPSAFKNRYNLTDKEAEALGQINYFVKCENANGISNTIPFAIKTCVKPGPDLTAPRITGVYPEVGYSNYGQTEKEIQIYTNEPADCKWSAESNKKYEDMENSMSCLTDMEDYGLFGWACNTALTGLDTDNIFYIKCKDQPWFAGTVNESDRNAMTEDYLYTLQVSHTPLIIEDFRPENGKETWSGAEPVSLELKLKTSGGIDGTSTCKWEGNGYSDYFTESNSNLHSYRITSATRGTYNIKLTCEDLAGNIAENSTSFSIKIDSQGPIITRIVYSSGLKITTDETSECRYSFSSKLNWENSTEMGGNGQIEHTTDWQLKTYYVQCADGYGNKGGKIVIKPYTLM